MKVTLILLFSFLTIMISSFHFYNPKCMFVRGKYLVERVGNPNRRNRCVRMNGTQKLVKTFDNRKGYQQPLTKTGAFEAAKLQYSHLPCIILVNPFLDQNVGSVARVMLNFGLTDLRIINPRCDIYSSSCEALASGGFEIVKNAKVYSDLKDSLSDLTVIMATSDRTREFSSLVLTPEEAASRCITFSRENEGKVGIMFGRESTGLSNEELILATHLVKIPTFNHFTSLNLAQAVNILGYELFKARNKADETYPPNEWLEAKNKQQLANFNDIEFLLQRTLKYLDEKLYQPNQSMRNAMYEQISSIYRRMKISKKEVKVLHGVVTALVGEHQHKFDRASEEINLSKNQSICQKETQHLQNSE